MPQEVSAKAGWPSVELVHRMRGEHMNVLGFEERGRHVGRQDRPRHAENYLVMGPWRHSYDDYVSAPGW
jgi:hypothetical protein